MTIQRNKGISLVAFPESFTVIDIETTGLSPDFCEIIEVAGIHIEGNKITNKFSSLIKPEEPIDPFIEELSGITNEMLENQPPVEVVLPQFLDFMGDRILVGHNVNFDINFIYDNWKRLSGCEFNNDYVDTMRISRRLHSDQKHHRLVDLIDRYGIPFEQRFHRASNDCEYTLAVLNALKKEVLASYGSINEFKQFCLRPSASKDLRSVQPTSENIDPSHPLFGQNCVFTGALTTMTRRQAAQIVVNCGGFCQNGITSETNFLIMGNMDYQKGMSGNKTSKLLKAEKLISKGADLQIMTEDVFLDMVDSK